MLACTGVVAGRRDRTNASASGERSTPTTVPCSASHAPFPPGPQPASRRRSVREPGRQEVGDQRAGVAVPPVVVLDRGDARVLLDLHSR